MRILIIGYGKMGKTIAAIANKRGHEIVGKITTRNADHLNNYHQTNTDVAIEFTSPSAAFNNVVTCIKNNIPTVSGTTGWNDRLPDAIKFCTENKGALFYAPNFSFGVNLFFQINRFLSELMKNMEDYDVSIEEVHHVHKKDKPSGTAISLAGDIVKARDLKGWTANNEDESDTLPINSERTGEEPGTHGVLYKGANDQIEIRHTTYNRNGFALGAVIAAEWLLGKTGVFGMDELIKNSK